MVRKTNLALLPLRDIIIFPNMVVPLFVGREKSIKALNEVMKSDKKIILVTQINSEIDEIKITHKANKRIGFAKGAVLAAEFIKNKKGFFTMEDVINNL